MDQIYILVEGLDDEIFFKYFFEKYLKNYKKVSFWQYAQRKKEDNVKFVKTIKQIENWDYIIFADFDSKSSIRSRKNEVQYKFDNELEDEKIFIVIDEIESWYAAGIDYRYFDLIRMSFIKDTQKVKKEFFNSQSLAKYHPKTNFLIEIMKHFQLKQSLKRNLSLNYTYYKLIGDKV